jgi:hypothetical protein
MAEETEKQTRTPRNYDSIEKGALALDLAERVSLKKKLSDSIEQELKDLKDKLDQANQIVNGL